jgi:phosphate-selective porin OprO/OprP
MNNTKTYLHVLMVAAALTTVTRGQNPELSVEERLKRIEAAILRLESRMNDTVSADELAPTLKEFSDLTRQIGYDGKPMTVVKAAGKEKTLTLGGYIQMQGEAGDAPDSRFTGINDRILLRRTRLTVKGAFAENFDFTIQSDFGNNSIGGVSGYRAQLADAFVNWSKYSFANVQIGQFKTPHGYEQLLSDTKTIFIERSLPNDQLTVSRQIGLGVNGAVANKRVTYGVGLFNGNGVNNGANDNENFMYAGRVAATAWTRGADKLAFGVNGFTSTDTGLTVPMLTGTFTGHRTGWGADGQLTLGQLDLGAEFLHLLANRRTGADATAEGWNAFAGYFVLPKTLQAVLRFETYDSNVDTANTTSDTWTLGLNYYLKGDDLKLSLNYLLGDPAGVLSDQGRLLGRLQVVF